MLALSALLTPKPTDDNSCNILDSNGLHCYSWLFARLEGFQILTQWGCEVGRVGCIWIPGWYWLNSRENWMLRRLLLIDRSLLFFKRSLLFFKRSLLFSKRRLLLVVPSLGILGVESAESAGTFFKLYSRAFPRIMRVRAREKKWVQNFFKTASPTARR